MDIMLQILNWLQSLEELMPMLIKELISKSFVKLLRQLDCLKNQEITVMVEMKNLKWEEVHKGI